jgi:hypothetical protein
MGKNLKDRQNLAERYHTMEHLQCQTSSLPHPTMKGPSGFYLSEISEIKGIENR